MFENKYSNTQKHKSDNMKGKLIAIGVGLENNELLIDESINALNNAPVIFAHHTSDEKKNKALLKIMPILKKRKDFNKLMIVEPVFPSECNEESSKNSWDMATVLLDSYLKSGRDVIFLTLEKPENSDFINVQKRLEKDFSIIIYP